VGDVKLHGPGGYVLVRKERNERLVVECIQATFDLELSRSSAGLPRAKRSRVISALPKHL
jgi:hypothetical protein